MGPKVEHLYDKASTLEFKDVVEEGNGKESPIVLRFLRPAKTGYVHSVDLRP